CFTPGTRIDTARGAVAVEDLVAGDKVLTRDNGYQPLAWTGRKDLDAATVAAHPGLAPVRIAAGALGAGLPARDLRVSPRHRMLISGPRAALMFGEREVLVAAADLLGLPGITQDAPGGAVSYVHVMCPGHEILRAEGSWSESFQPAALVLRGMAEETRAELLALFPELDSEAGQGSFTAARPALTPAEARALFAA
ncbi:MAG TPA: Hint domain-containing protein, partial [Paracoccus sp.]|nr:Hint domain-containing protein [Paracoccus sp. (in: a-proteobacteria)]